METYIVSIPITTDMDSSQLLDIINSQISQILSDEIESYGYEVEVDENPPTADKGGRRKKRTRRRKKRKRKKTRKRRKRRR